MITTTRSTSEPSKGSEPPATSEPSKGSEPPATSEPSKGSEPPAMGFGGGPAYTRRAMMSLGLGAALLTAACSSSGKSNGGTGGAGGAAEDAAIDTGPHPCAGMAISFTSNVPANLDPAKSRVMVDFTSDTTDLPIGNSPRTIELWA